MLYRRDFGIDLSIIKFEELNKFEINYAAMRTDFEMILPSKNMVWPWKSRPDIKVR